LVRFKLLNFEVGWTGDVWLKEFPFGCGLSAIQKKGSAKQFYSDDEKKIKAILEEKGVTYETDGNSENRPRKELK